MSYYRRPLIYFSTHPSDKERILNANNAFKNKTIIGKKFQIDSTAFFSIKQRAIDETIYLLFEGLQYDECLEMAYLQYLYHPKDEFYLFFITECLRRQMIAKKHFGKKVFITNNYKKLTPTAYNLKKMPSLKGKNKQKLNPENYSKSIFVNLENEIYNLTENDLAKIKAADLMRKDSIEFLFNEDALLYFSKKINTNACIFNMQRLFLNEPIISECEAKINNTELENIYLDAVSDYQTFKKNGTNYKKAPIILFNINTYSKSNNRTTYFYDPFLTEELYTEYNKVGDKFSNGLVDIKNKFNFRSIQKIKFTTLFLESLRFKGLFNKKVKSYDFLSIFPELAGDINSLGYNKLLFLEINTINAFSSKSDNWLSSMIFEGWEANIYIVDLKNKKIKREVKRFRFSLRRKRETKIAGIYAECLKLAKKN